MAESVKELPPGCIIFGIPAEPAPLLLVVRVDASPQTYDPSRIVAVVQDAFKAAGKECPPLVIAPPEISIEAILDPRAKADEPAVVPGAGLVLCRACGKMNGNRLFCDHCGHCSV